MIYQTMREAEKCEQIEHIRDCNRTLARHPIYEQLVRGDVLVFCGMQKIVDREEVMRFAVVVYFADGTVEDKINLFFAKGAKRIVEVKGDFGDRFICSAF